MFDFIINFLADIADFFIDPLVDKMVSRAVSGFNIWKKRRAEKKQNIRQ